MLLVHEKRAPLPDASSQAHWFVAELLGCLQADFGRIAWPVQQHRLETVREVGSCWLCAGIKFLTYPRVEFYVGHIRPNGFLATLGNEDKTTRVSFPPVLKLVL